MPQTEYVRNVDVDVRYRVRFVVERGTVLEFVVQLEVAIKGGWTVVVRFDTAHGFAHYDRYTPTGKVVRHQLLPVSDFGHALTLATRTIRDRWREICEPFREKPK